MKPISPGVYVDADTPHNRDVLTEEACRQFRQAYPDSPLTVE